MNNEMSERHKKLINILLKSNKPITSKQLADILNVSSRTIRNDLNDLNHFFIEQDICLNKKPGLGIWLKVKPNQKERLLDKVYDIAEFKKKYSPKQRRLLIIKELLIRSKWVTMIKLGEKLYVSRSTIFKDIEVVKEWLGDYKLNLEKRRNRGIRVLGAEVRIREAIVNLFFEFLDRTEFDQILHLLMNDEKIRTAQFDLLEEFFGRINLQKIKSIVYDRLTKNTYQFSDRAILYLVLYISISVKRFKLGKEIIREDNNRIINNLVEIDFLDQTLQMKEEFKQEFSIEVPRAELAAIVAQFFCLELKKDYFLNNYHDLESLLSGQTLNIANQFLELINQDLNLDFEAEQDLFLDLIFQVKYIYSHARYGVSRKKNFQFSEILLSELKKDNKAVFKLAQKIKSLFPANIKAQVKIEDIEYIFMLLLAALKRNQKVVDAIFVCSKQNPTYKLILAKLENELNGLRIMDVLSYYEAKHKKIDNVELIISCSELNDYANNVVISPLVNSEDIKMILDKISKKDLTSRK